MEKVCNWCSENNVLVAVLIALGSAFLVFVVIRKLTGTKYSSFGKDRDDDTCTTNTKEATYRSTLLRHQLHDPTTLLQGEVGNGFIFDSPTKWMPHSFDEEESEDGSEEDSVEDSEEYSEEESEEESDEFSENASSISSLDAGVVDFTCANKTVEPNETERPRRNILHEWFGLMFVNFVPMSADFTVERKSKPKKRNKSDSRRAKNIELALKVAVECFESLSTIEELSKMDKKLLCNGKYLFSYNQLQLVSGDEHLAEFKKIRNKIAHNCKFFVSQSCLDKICDKLNSVWIEITISAMEANLQLHGKYHPKTLDSKYNLAVLYIAQGKHLEAKPLLAMVWKSRKKVLGKGHKIILKAKQKLDELHQSQYEPLRKRDPTSNHSNSRSNGRKGQKSIDELNEMVDDDNSKIAKVDEQHQSSLKSKTSLDDSRQPPHDTSPERIPSSSVSSQTTSNKINDNGRREQSIDELDEMLVDVDNKTRNLGKKHPDTLKSMHQLATLYQVRGELSDAKRILLTVLELRQEVLGVEHIDTVSTFDSIGSLYDLQGQSTEAARMWVITYNLKKEILGGFHPDTIVSLTKLGTICTSNGLYSDAQMLLREAEYVTTQTFGEYHVRAMPPVVNLGVLYKCQGQYTKAEPLYERALEGSMRNYGEEHPSTLSVMDNLAEVYIMQGKYSEADSLLRATLENRRKVLGTEHRETITSMNNLGMLHKSQGQYLMANQLLTDTVLLSKRRVLGADHPNTLKFEANLARVQEHILVACRCLAIVQYLVELMRCLFAPFITVPRCDGMVFFRS